MAGTGKVVAIVGSGMIGKSWAMLFAAQGFSVRLNDVSQTLLTKALENITLELNRFEGLNILRGSLTAAEQLSCITTVLDLKAAVAGADYVQECVPEDLNMRIKIWEEIDKYVTKDGCVLASSSSCIAASQFTEHLSHRNQCMVVHPVNPPYFVPLVEIIPAPWTDPNIANDAKSVQEMIGQSPVLMTREVPGFSLNRIQYAIINECWKQVESGLLTVKEVDTVMKEGLGMRYAFMGPFETMHMNAPGGMSDYCRRYSDTVRTISADITVDRPDFNAASVEQVSKQIEDLVPTEELGARSKWRDNCLMKLAILKKNN